MTADAVKRAREIIAGVPKGPWKHDWGNWDVETAWPDRTQLCSVAPGHCDAYGKEHVIGEFIAAARTGWTEALDDLELCRHALEVQSKLVTSLTEDNYKLRAEIETNAERKDSVVNLGRENAKLRDEVDRLQKGLGPLSALLRENEELRAENERLQEFADNLNRQIAEILDEKVKLRAVAEAVEALYPFMPESIQSPLKAWRGK